MRRGDSGCANMCDCNASGRDCFGGGGGSRGCGDGRGPEGLGEVHQIRCLLEDLCSGSHTPNLELSHRINRYHTTMLLNRLLIHVIEPRIKYTMMIITKYNHEFTADELHC